MKSPFYGSGKQWTGKWVLYSDSNNKPHFLGSSETDINAGPTLFKHHSFLFLIKMPDYDLPLHEQSKSSWGTENPQHPA